MIVEEHFTIAIAAEAGIHLVKTVRHTGLRIYEGDVLRPRFGISTASSAWPPAFAGETF